MLNFGELLQPMLGLPHFARKVYFCVNAVRHFQIMYPFSNVEYNEGVTVFNRRAVWGRIHAEMFIASLNHRQN